jgi:hypothetical protein
MAPNSHEKFLADRNIHSKPKSKSKSKFIYNSAFPSPNP